MRRLLAALNSSKFPVGLATGWRRVVGRRDDTFRYVHPRDGCLSPPAGGGRESVALRHRRELIPRLPSNGQVSNRLAGTGVLVSAHRRQRC